MTRLDPHDRYTELAAGQALFALEPADEQIFLAHLYGCARCAQDLRAHRSTLSDLAYAVEDVAPPESLFEGIRAAVTDSDRPAMWTAHGSPADLASARSAAAGGPVVGSTGQVYAGGRVLSFTGRVRALPHRVVLATAAAAVLVLALGGWNVSLREQRAQEVAANSRVVAAVHELGAPGSQPVPLRGADGTVLAVALLKGSDLTLLVDGLPANTDDSTYVLWARVGVEVRPVGAFSARGKGLDVQDGLHVPGDAARLTDLLVTREPGRVAPDVPGSPVLAAGRA